MTFHHGSPAKAHGNPALGLTKDTVVDRDLRYRFSAHFHPYVRELIHELVERSVSGLQGADTAYQRTAAGSVVTLPDGRPRPVLYHEVLASYQPTGRVTQPRPVKDIDFAATGGYAVYNWELFYHIPLTIGIHLSRNQRFEEAQRWFHHIFDPTDPGPDPSPQRFWKVRQFHQIEVRQIEEILLNLSTQADQELLVQTLACIHAWKDAPFRPHLVARYRQSAYMIKAVTAYLDNLIDWGDVLFRQDTGESINEATQLYVLAANILGPRPQEVPRKGWQRARSYEDLRAELDPMSNAFTELEVDIPFDLLPQPNDASDHAALATVASLGTALYFCVPRNDMLLAYWDRVADRLFKIRNSLNIQGVFRQLPLFEPPIDPALLAKATAAGLDIGAVIAGLHQPLPLVRFQVLAAQAAELCQEVKALGAGLLSAIEKEDAEALGLLRAQHERAMLGLVEQVRYAQLQEAVKAREGVERSFAAALARHTYYERLLGRPEAEIAIPELDELDTETLSTLRLSASEPELTARDIPVDIAADLGASGGHQISSHEATELDKLGQAQDKKGKAAFIDKIGAALGMVPNFSTEFEPFGTGGSVSFGGSNLAARATLESSRYKEDADQLAYEAATASKIGSYARREQEWAFQSNLALGEIAQVYKQWRAAQLREAIAEQELRNHRQQIRHAEQIEDFLSGEKVAGRTKTSTTALYAWLRRETRALYGQYFQLAYDVAARAERALQQELGDPTQSFLQFGHQSGMEGLLAGERLHLDVKRMQAAYHELNRREYELTRQVSLRQLDPAALLRLRATGSCELVLPESLFDLDCPGHYFRRIRSVAVSLPCVVGPQASVNCTLTLLRSTVRTSAALLDGEYARDGEDTARFRDHFGRIESIVTSVGTNDSGLFEANLRDERYLPFEGAGAVSTWSVSLPAQVRQFDYDSISDVILHLRYTAREGGAPLRSAAEAHLEALVGDAAAVGSVRMLSLRHDFPTEWARFAAAAPDPGGTAPLEVTLRPEHYPFWAPAAIGLRALELYARPGAVAAVSAFADEAGTQLQVAMDGAGAPDGLLYGRLAEQVDPPAPVGAFTWHFDDNTMDDIWLVLTWGSA